VTITCDLLIS